MYLIHTQPEKLKPTCTSKTSHRSSSSICVATHLDRAATSSYPLLYFFHYSSPRDISLRYRKHRVMHSCITRQEMKEEEWRERGGLRNGWMIAHSRSLLTCGVTIKSLMCVTSLSGTTHRHTHRGMKLQSRLTVKLITHEEAHTRIPGIKHVPRKHGRLYLRTIHGVCVRTTL